MASSVVGQQQGPSDPATLYSKPDAEEVADEEEYAELTTFQCRDAYVYRIPPAATNGHRAELWRVDDWDAEVAVTVVSRQEECWVRLLDKCSGELFAECPIPKSQPLATVVEPVVDSSRYYVLRIEDRSSRRHAFIGFGFRDRSDASNFNAALDDHLQHLRRKKAADAMRRRYSQARLARASGAGTDDAASSDSGTDREEGDSSFVMDLALKPGQTINIATPWASSGGMKTPPSQRMAAIAAQARANFVSPSPLKIGVAISSGAAGGGCGGGLLPPPPQRPTLSPRALPTREKPATSVSEPSSPVLDFNPASSPSLAGSREADEHKPLFRPFDDSCFEAAGRPSPAKDGVSLSASMVRDQDRDESVSMAALSLKSVGSGGSSLVTPSSCCPSETGSDSAPSATAAVMAVESSSPSPSIGKSGIRSGSADFEIGTQKSEQRKDDVAGGVADAGDAGDWGEFVAS